MPNSAECESDLIQNTVYFHTFPLLPPLTHTYTHTTQHNTHTTHTQHTHNTHTLTLFFSFNLFIQFFNCFQQSMRDAFLLNFEECITNKRVYIFWLTFRTVSRTCSELDGAGMVPQIPPQLKVGYSLPYPAVVLGFT